MQADISPEGFLPVVLANVDCDGDEVSLLQCSSSPPDIRKCPGFSTRLACTNSVASAHPQTIPNYYALLRVHSMSACF